MKIKISKNLLELSKIFPEKLYVVGGYVRNSILKIKTDDIDICSKLKYQEVESLLNNSKYKIVAKSKKLGTMYILCGKEKYEYTTFRSETYDDSGKHRPTNVEFVDDLYKDAYRRDFTINAIYYDILGKKIVDPFNGICDIKNKVLKEIRSEDNPLKYSVFIDDGLRILRLVRFASELCFKVEEETLNNAIKYIDRLNDIYPERKKEELLKILNSENKYKNIKVLNKSNKTDEQIVTKILDKKEYIINYFTKKFVAKNKLDYALELLNKLKILKYFGLNILNVNYNYVKSFGLEGFLIDLINSNYINYLEIEKFLNDYQFSNKNYLNSLVRSYVELKDNGIDLEIIIKNFSNLKNIKKYLKDNKNYNLIIKYEKFIIKNKIPVSLKELSLKGNDIFSVVENKEEIGLILNTLLKECQNSLVKNKKIDLQKRAYDIINKNRN